MKMYRKRTTEQDLEKILKKNKLLLSLGARADDKGISIKKILSKGDTFLSGLCTKKKFKFNLKRIDSSIDEEDLELIHSFFVVKDSKDDHIRYKEISDLILLLVKGEKICQGIMS